MILDNLKNTLTYEEEKIENTFHHIISSLNYKEEKLINKLNINPKTSYATYYLGVSNNKSYSDDEMSFVLTSLMHDCAELLPYEFMNSRSISFDQFYKDKADIINAHFNLIKKLEIKKDGNEFYFLNTETLFETPKIDISSKEDNNNYFEKNILKNLLINKLFIDKINQNTRGMFLGYASKITPPLLIKFLMLKTNDTYKKISITNK